MSNLISVYIRPHLISFLFQELEGDSKAVYENKKVKLARVTKRSVLGQLLHLFKTRAVNKVVSDKVLGFSVFLSIDSEDVDETQALVNERNYQAHTELKLLPEDVTLLNNHLESIFRISLVEFVKGYTKGSSASDFVNKGIHEFMLAHELYDTDVDPESLRRMYYNSVKKNKILHRIQIPTSNQIKNYQLAQ